MDRRKILLVSTFASGGAGSACYRLKLALKQAGQEVKMLVRFPGKVHDPDVASYIPHTYKPAGMVPALQAKLAAQLRRFKLLPDDNPYLKQEKLLAGRASGWDYFSDPSVGYDLTLHPLYEWADVIHLHWVSEFVDLSHFFRTNKKPVFWTLHDEGGYTGGCHFTEGCIKYQDGCKVCPQLAGTPNERFSAKSFKYRAQLFGGIAPEAIRFITPSRWLADQVSTSVLLGKFGAKHIFNAFDPDFWIKQDKVTSRAALDLPQDKRIYLFVSHNNSYYRKGFNHLKAWVDTFDPERELLVVVGQTDEPWQHPAVKLLPFISDINLMPKLYSAADVCVIPSVYDNSPNVMVEALLCQTPVIAFNIGGLPDLVPARYLANTVSWQGLQAVANTLWQDLELGKPVVDRNAVAQQVGASVVAQQHILLYQS